MGLSTWSECLLFFTGIQKSKTTRHSVPLPCCEGCGKIGWCDVVKTAPLFKNVSLWYINVNMEALVIAVVYFMVLMSLFVKLLVLVLFPWSTCRGTFDLHTPFLYHKHENCSHVISFNHHHHHIIRSDIFVRSCLF